MDNLVPILVAVLGAGGFGAFFREIIAGVVKVAGGMSARESKRKVDIVQQRDEALVRADRAWAAYDAQAEKLRELWLYVTRLQRQILLAGGEFPDEPELEQTITKAQLRELRETKEEP